MAGEFGTYINEKRKGRGVNGADILLRDLAQAMGNMSVSYLSDIMKGRRNPPDINLLEIMAEVFLLWQVRKGMRQHLICHSTLWMKISLMCVQH